MPEYTEAGWIEALWELELEEIYEGDNVYLVTYPEHQQTQFYYSNKREKENLYFFFEGILLDKRLQTA